MKTSLFLINLLGLLIFVSFAPHQSMADGCSVGGVTYSCSFSVDTWNYTDGGCSVDCGKDEIARCTRAGCADEGAMIPSSCKCISQAQIQAQAQAAQAKAATQAQINAAAAAKVAAQAKIVFNSGYSPQVKCTYVGPVTNGSGSDKVTCGGTAFVVALQPLRPGQVNAIDGSSITNRKALSGDILIDLSKVQVFDGNGQSPASPCVWKNKLGNGDNATANAGEYITVSKNGSCGRSDNSNTASYAGPAGACMGQVLCTDNETPKSFTYPIACAASEGACPTVNQCLTDNQMKVTKPSGTTGLTVIQNKNGGDGICFDGDEALDAPQGNCKLGLGIKGDDCVKNSIAETVPYPPAVGGNSQGQPTSSGPGGANSSGAATFPQN